MTTPQDAGPANDRVPDADQPRRSAIGVPAADAKTTILSSGNKSALRGAALPFEPVSWFRPAQLLGDVSRLGQMAGGSLLGSALTRPLGSPFSLMGSTALQAIAPTLDFTGFSPWLQSHRIYLDVDKLERDLLPENLRTADIDFDPDSWLDWISEGIPVAYVLDTATLEQLAAAETPSARRRIIGRRWESVLRATDALLREVTSADMVKFVRPAQRAIDGTRAGFSELAQAYAANTLDTLVRSQYSGAERKRWVQRSGADDEPGGFRNTLYFAQLQTVHAGFYDGPVPSTFNRHGSAHAVGQGRQYSRLNAVLGIGHLVSAMWKHELDARMANRRRQR